MTLNDKFTLVIPVKDRSEFLFRLLSYLRIIGFPYKIILSDGSFDKIENTKIVKKFQSILRIKYLRFKYDKNYNDFLIKMFKTLKHVKTKHVLLLPNDDFVNLSFLKKNIKINNALISGINLDFKVNNFFRYINDVGRITFFNEIKPSYHIKLSSDNISERLKHIRYFNPFETIHLTKDLSMVFKLCIEFSVKNYKEFSWFFKFIPLYFNKVDFKNEPLTARQTNTFFSEGNLLLKKEQQTTLCRFEKFKKFICFKLKIKVKKNIFNDRDFPITANVNFISKVRIFLVVIKSFFSKYILDFDRRSFKNHLVYKNIFLAVLKKFNEEIEK